MVEIIGGLIGLGVQIMIAAKLNEALRRLPEKYRHVQPGYAWLILIPLAGFVILLNLLVSKMPDSFSRYFADHGGIPDGIEKDCGKKWATYFMYSTIGMFIPIANVVVMFFWIYFMVKSIGQVNKITDAISA
jgi:hypothetical protein